MSGIDRQYNTTWKKKLKEANIRYVIVKEALEDAKDLLQQLNSWDLENDLKDRIDNWFDRFGDLE